MSGSTNMASLPSKGLQLNLGSKEGKDMLDLSSDSDSDQDYEEVNEIVQSFINKQQRKANQLETRAGANMGQKYGARDLLSDSSSDDDDFGDNGESINQLIQNIKNKDGASTKKNRVANEKNDMYRNADIVTLIELNERQSDTIPEKLIEQASQLFSFDKDFYNVKKELLLYSHFQQISQSLYEDKEHPYFGVVSCINMFRAKNCSVIFVGNSQGYIRVYDIQSQKQMKPLFDP